MDRPVALLVDPDENNLEKMAARLHAHAFRTFQCQSFVDASRRLDQIVPQLAVVALDLPDRDGLELLEHPALSATREIILTDSRDDPDRIRRGMLAGASYFFCHPANGRLLDELFDCLAAEVKDSHARSQSESVSSMSLDRLGPLHGSSPAMHRLYRDIRRAAAVDANLLLVGETGSGKELVAQTIHLLSERRTGPFFALHCGTIPADRMERELFGQEVHRFGAMESRQTGYLERAFGGTLFLDEIVELPMEMQIKLLHVMESGQVQRMGGEDTFPADVRLITATNRNPEEIVRGQQFREDLYLRMASYPLEIPALRNRGNDVYGLAEYFLGQFNEQSGRIKTIGRDAAAVLENYSWPGNVRELRSVMEQAYMMAEREIAPEHLPDLNGQPASGGDVLQLTIGDSVQDAEKKLTLATLSFYNGDKRRAAQTLGVSLKTLYNRINAYQSDKRSPSVSGTAD